MESTNSLSEWEAVLDRITASIDRALEECDSHERTLDAVDASSSHADIDTAERHCVSLLDGRLAALQARLQAAEVAAAQIESLVDDDRQIVADWQATASSVRQRLTLAGFGVS